MTSVTLVCQTCGHKARRPLQHQVACRGTHETDSENATCPFGHGVMSRLVQESKNRKKDKWAAIRLKQQLAEQGKQ